MKKLIFTCAILAAGSVISFAQSAKKATAAQAAPTNANNVSPEKMAEGRSKGYAKFLNLNDVQTKAVYEAELDYWKQQQTGTANGGVIGTGQAAQMEMAKDMRFKTALTPEQYAKYEATKPKPGAPMSPAPVGK